MGQEICCKINKTSNEQITHEIESYQCSESNSAQDAQSRKANELVPQNKKKRIQNFYGTPDCAVTKTMTKQLVIPELQKKIHQIPCVIQECTEENSKNGMESCVGMDTHQIIQYKTKKTYQNIEKSIVDQKELKSS